MNIDDGLDFIHGNARKQPGSKRETYNRPQESFTEAL